MNVDINTLLVLRYLGLGCSRHTGGSYQFFLTLISIRFPIEVEEDFDIAEESVFEIIKRTFPNPKVPSGWVDAPGAT